MKIRFLALIASVLLFSACVKNVEDEGVNPDFIPHFTYGGFTYYIHPSLGEMTWTDAKKACRNHDGYGFHDWFLPSQGEVDAARNAGFRWVEGWTSTKHTNTDSYFFYDADYYYGEGRWSWDETGKLHIVIPMRKQ